VHDLPLVEWWRPRDRIRLNARRTTPIYWPC